jgi:hypothetical protein
LSVTQDNFVDIGRIHPVASLALDEIHECRGTAAVDLSVRVCRGHGVRSSLLQSLGIQAKMVMNPAFAFKRVKFFPKDCTLRGSGEVVQIECVTCHGKPIRNSSDRCGANASGKKYRSCATVQNNRRTPWRYDKRLVSLTQRGVSRFCVRVAIIILSYSNYIGTRPGRKAAQGIYFLLADGVVANQCDASSMVKRRKLRSAPGLKFNGMVTLGKLPFPRNDD